MTAPADRPLRIVIADDQASVREGLVLLLGGLPDIEVVGEAADGNAAVAMCSALRPDVVLMDVRMPAMDGIEAEHRPDAILLDLHMPVLDGAGATRRLAAEHPGVAVVVLTTFADDSSVTEAVQAGARSYLTKDADRTHIARALHAAASGLTVFDPRAHATLMAAMAARPDPGPAGTAPAPAPDGLTQREAEILALIARGLTNPEIAAQLYLSNHTIKTHISRIFAKTGSRDRAAAIGYAHQHGIG